MRSENSSRSSQRHTSTRLRESNAARNPSKTTLDDGKDGAETESRGTYLNAASRQRAEKEARAAYVPRQPKPKYANNPSSKGPARTPRDPANVQRAMFCSWRLGSESIRLACERATKAPEDGKKRMKEKRNK